MNKLWCFSTDENLVFVSPQSTEVSCKATLALDLCTICRGRSIHLKLPH